MIIFHPSQVIWLWLKSSNLSPCINLIPSIKIKRDESFSPTRLSESSLIFDFLFNVFDKYSQDFIATINKINKIKKI